MSRQSGLRMPNKLESEHHLLRYVSWTRLRKDENDNVLGVVGAAFRLRENEDFLSATWAEFFDGSHDEQLVQSVKAIRASRIDVRPRSGFAIGNVGQVDEACTGHGHRVRFLHEREEDNEAHAALRRWPRDAEDLFDLLADEAWGRTVLNKDVP